MSEYIQDIGELSLTITTCLVLLTLAATEDLLPAHCLRAENDSSKNQLSRFTCEYSGFQSSRRVAVWRTPPTSVFVWILVQEKNLILASSAGKLLPILLR